MMISSIQISKRLLIPAEFPFVRCSRCTLHCAFSYFMGSNRDTPVGWSFSSIIKVSWTGSCGLADVRVPTVFSVLKRRAQPLKRGLCWLCHVLGGPDPILFTDLRVCLVQLQEKHFLVYQPDVCLHSQWSLHLMHKVDVNPMAFCIWFLIVVLDVRIDENLRHCLI